MKATELLHKVASEITETAKEMPFEKRAYYTNWMAQHYHMVTHSMRMLELSAGFAKSQKEHDRWFHHLRGEVNHHLVLEADAAALDVKVQDVPALPEINAIVRSVYGGIITVGPHWLFGHALALEGFACKGGPGLLDLLVREYGSSKFMSLHVDADDGHDGHFEVGCRDVDALPREAQKEVIMAAEITGTLYREALRKIQAQAGSKKRAA